MNIAIVLVLQCLLLINVNAKYECSPRKFRFESVVCVCNATLCGNIEDVGKPSQGEYHWYVSNEGGKRLDFSTGKIIDGYHPRASSFNLRIRPSESFQKMMGWGGTMTDSALKNIFDLSVNAQEKLFQAYFGRKGARYNLARVPIGGTEFSEHKYNYDNVTEDHTLKHFALLQREDREWKIPAMKKAQSLNGEVQFLTVAWSAPDWMKHYPNETENAPTQKNDFLKNAASGQLLRTHRQTFANYIIKFLDEYDKENLHFKSISSGYQPFLFWPQKVDLNMMNWEPQDLGEWIADILGPTLAMSKHNKTEIYSFDDQRVHLPHKLLKVFNNKKAKKYVSSIAVHWHTDEYVLPTLLEDIHDLFPDKPLFMSEANTGFKYDDLPRVKLGSWARAEWYFHKMIENVRYWVSGWIDHNMALDIHGGPSWVEQLFVDAPIIVDKMRDEFFLQPLYFAMVHFSHFVPRDSVRINIALEVSDIVDWVAFRTPENQTVCILNNRVYTPEKVTIMLDNNKTIPIELSPRSFNTLVF